MILLDSNVVSELLKPQPDSKVMAWLEGLDFLIPAPVLAELQEGAETAPPSRRAEISLQIDNVIAEFADAFVDWDYETARVWARLRHSPEVKRQPQALWDSLIDAMGVRYNATIATRNVKDFRHSKTFNPWTD